MQINALDTIVPRQTNTEALFEVLETKGTPNAQGMYPTDGTAEVVEIEERLAGLEDLSQQQIIAYHTGMTALKQSIEVALFSAAPGAKRSIAMPEQAYSQTTELGHYFRRLGIAIHCFDSGDPEDIEYVVREENPTVLVSETVSNGPQMPVLDHQHLLGFSRDLDEDKQPTLILDNTLPMSTGLHLSSLLEDTDKVIVANSGMKAITRNQAELGFAFSRHPRLLQGLRDYRITSRGMPSYKTSKEILSSMPSSREDFDARNRRLFKASVELADILFKAEQAGAPFSVAHPSIGEHRNKVHCEATFADGIAPAPVFYLNCKTDQIDQKELSKKLYDDNPSVTEQAFIGQSFGFDQTAILANLCVPVVRVAAGAETDIEALGKALYNASISR